MAVRISIDSVDTDAVRQNLKAADVIYLTDPNKEDFQEQLFGQDLPARIRRPGSEPYEIQQVEIEVDSTSADQLEKAKAAVIAAKGRVTVGP